MEQGQENPIDDGAKPAQFLELPVKLTEVELADCSYRLAENIGALESIETERKADNDHWNAKAKAVKPVIERLAKMVRERQELRQVEVRELLDGPAKTAKTIRVDTGEVIRTREMTEAERQRSLFETSEPMSGGPAEPTA